MTGESLIGQECLSFPGAVILNCLSMSYTRFLFVCLFCLFLSFFPVKQSIFGKRQEIIRYHTFVNS